MKILQISPQIPLPLNDGGRISIYGITKSLSQRGHEVYFVSYTRKINTKKAESEMEKICTPYFLKVNTNNNFFDALINLFSRIPYNISKYIKRNMEDYLTSFFKNENVDIVIIDHLHLAWTIKLLRKLTNAPIFLREHNLELKIMKRYSEQQKNLLLKIYSKIQFKKFVKYEPRICEQFDKCIMITKNDENELLKLNSNIKTCVIPAGVEKKLVEKDINAYKIQFSLFHIGSLNWLPNYDGIIWFVNNILPLIIKKIPQIKLYVYGNGLEKLTIPIKLKDNVIKVGYVENIWEEVENKQLAIVPLRVGSGIRLKILEMLALGHNIISTSVGKEGIDANDNEHLLMANSIDEFVNKTIKLFNNEYDTKRMSINGKKLIKEKYTWEYVGESLEKVFFG